MLACIIGFILIYHFGLSKLSNYILENLDSLAELNFYLKFSVGTLILVMYQLFLIPLQSAAIMAISYLMGNYFAGMGVFLASITISGSLTYLLVNSCLREKIVKRYQKNMLFRVIDSEVRKHPNKTSIMVRLMYIPVTLKNVSLSVSGNGYFLFMFYYYCSAMIIGSLLVLTGIEFKNQ